MTQNNYPEGLDELAKIILLKSGIGLYNTAKISGDELSGNFARAILDALAERGYVLVDAKKQEVIHQVWQKFCSWKDCDEIKYNKSPPQSRRVLYAIYAAQEADMQVQNMKKEISNETF